MEAGMMTTTNGSGAGAIIERVVALGDLEGLKPMERAHYYSRVCESLGLNPLTSPFAYIKLQGKLSLYAKKDTTDQLRKLHNVSTKIVSRERTDDLYIVTARASMPSGRAEESIGAVSIAGKRGEDLANALMKAETKAKRRVTLSICGLGWLDETEVQDIKGARHVEVTADGEIVEPPQQDLTKQLAASVDWNKWAAEHLAAINGAPDLGSLNAAFADVNDDRRNLNPPTEHLHALTLAKDARKAELRAVPK